MLLFQEQEYNTKHLSAEDIEPKILFLFQLPQALLLSRQMEISASTECTIVFIKQHTKGSLTVSYFNRKAKLSR